MAEIEEKNTMEEQQSKEKYEGTNDEEKDPIKIFESIVAKYGKMMNLNMFKYFHSPGFNKKHPENVNTISYILDGKNVKIGCMCGASLDLTDYNKLDKV